MAVELLRRSLLMVCLLWLVVLGACESSDVTDTAETDDEASSDAPGLIENLDDDSTSDNVGGEPPMAMVGDSYWPPDQRGPYEVGVKTIYLVDESRYEIWGLRDRELPLEIWYPATGKHGRLNTMSDMVGRAPGWAMDLLKTIYGDSFEELWSIVTTARRDDWPLVSGGPYPVILFSHGLTAVRFQNYSLCEYLASHGFIVVAPDHYGNAIFANLSDGAIIFYNPLTLLTAALDRPIDVDFIYEQLVMLADSGAAPLYLAMDLGFFAVTGHSYGGLTALESGLVSDYLAAIAPINPAWFDLLYMNFDRPMFMLQSDKDNIVGLMNPAARAAFDEAPTTKKLHLELLNAGHYSATDACWLLPPSIVPPAVSGCDGNMIDPVLANQITEAYLTAFFKATYTGDQRYADYLLVNHFTDNIEVTSSWE